VETRIVLIKSTLTVLAFVFAIVLPSLALTAWFSVRLSDPAKARLFTIHRWIGRAYLLIVFTVGVVYCLLAIGIQGYDRRVFTHSALGLAVVALLVVKVLAVRGKIPPLSDHLPKLGSMLAVLTLGIFLTSAFWYFRAQAAQAAPASATQATTSGTLPSGKLLFQSKCSQCHATSRATSAPRDRAAWSATVQRMITQNGAGISPAEAAAIVDYLSANYGAAK